FHGSAPDRARTGLVQGGLDLHEDPGLQGLVLGVADARAAVVLADRAAHDRLGAARVDERGVRPVAERAGERVAERALEVALEGLVPEELDAHAAVLL